jgi:5-methylcytosine-specific restriction endonuclease McrA
MILKLVAEGSVTLTTIALLRPHLTAENHEALFAEARHKSKRDVEYQIACLAPKPAAPALLRRLPNHPAQGPTAIRAVEPRGSIARAEIEHLETLAGTDLVPAVAADLLISPSQPAEASSAPEPQSRVSVLAKDRYLLRVTLNSETYAKLKRAQQLMSHSVRDGNPAVILDKALDLLVAGLERAKIANVRRPRAQRMVRPSPSSSGSRHIPAALRREVWARDGGRCAFVGTRGRCTETARLELHHVTPFARGGPTGVDNLALRCRAHNVYESEQIFGPRPRRPRKAPRQSASP